MQPIELELAIRPRDASEPRCAAFVLLEPRGGRSVTGLLAALGSDPVYRTGSVYLLPTSGQDLTTSGIVWVGPSMQPAECPAGAVPLRCVTPSQAASGSVWMPSGSTLSPSVPEEILSSQLTGDPLLRVWLPSIGLIGFGRDDQLRPCDWLAAPPSTEPAFWTSPPETWSPPHAMIELGMVFPPSAESFLDDMQQEIGSPDGSLLDADEDGRGQSKPSPATRAKNWLLEKLDALAKQRQDDRNRAADRAKPAPSRPAPGRTAANQRGSITASLAAKMSRMLQGERDRQIQKLLKMFDSNPDAALKYAIPIGGIADAFRGFAIPGTALLERLIDFSLSSLGGGAGRPIDPWSIDARLQSKLQGRYRAQANRELAAGRFRRAAYIFAHLLSDFRGAAQALEKGRFYGEAAVIYRDRLTDKQNAARCLALGGMHREACELYVELKLFESAGEVLLQAGLEDEAREMFETAFNDAVAKGSVIEAAHLLDRRLDRRADAIELLCDQWPNGFEPLRACETVIDWLGHDGLHDRALEQLKTMSEQAGESTYAELAHLSQWIAGRYPDHRVRLEAEDHCRLATARALERSSPQRRRRALSALARLDASDSQLRRDTQKFAHQSDSINVEPSLPSLGGRLIRLPDLRLPPDALYVDFRVVLGQLFALSMRNNRLFLTHAPSPEPGEEVNTTKSADLGNEQFMDLNPKAVFFKSITFRSDSIVATACAPMAKEVRLGPDRAPVQPAPSLRIESTPIVVASISASLEGSWHVELLDGNLVLRHSDGPTFDLTKAWVENWQGSLNPGDQIAHVSLALVGGAPYIALDNVLVAPRDGEIREIALFDEPIRAISGSLPKTRSRIVVAHCSGLEVVNLDLGEVVNVCRQRGYSHCIWSPSGKLVAWSDGQLHCFESRRGAYARVAETRELGRADREVSPAHLLSLSPAVIGVAYDTGRISRYRLPS